MSETGFVPDWESPPGATIRTTLEQRRITHARLAKELGVSLSELNSLLAGDLAITSDVASSLAAFLGASSEFWLRREHQYRAAKELAALAVPGGWLDRLPLADMTTWGWVARYRSRVQQAKECLAYFGVGTFNEWSERYGSLLAQAAFRKSPRFEANPAAVAAWVRRGELVGERGTPSEWNPSSFEASLGRIRTLTRLRRPEVFVPLLQEECAKSGVVAAIIRAPRGCPASGVTTFLPTNRALILLSFRYLSDDHFWFTFFHEAAHLLLHGRNRTFIEDDRPRSPEEMEADTFAAELLVPKASHRLLQSVALNRWSIRHLAKDLGLSPGIVVGQLQFLGRLRHNQMNGLKTRYRW